MGNILAVHGQEGLAEDDTPQILSLSLIYQLPLGSGRRFVNKSGVVDKLLGGWHVSSEYHSPRPVENITA